MSLYLAGKLRKAITEQPEPVERGVIVGREARNVVIVQTEKGVVRAVNTVVSSRPGLPVVIEKKGAEWVVAGVDYFAFQRPPTYHTVPYHAEGHIMGHPDGGDDLVFLPKIQYIPLEAVPTEPPSRLVRICAGTLIDTNGRLISYDELTYNFGPIIDNLTASTEVLLVINRETLEPEVIEKNASGELIVPDNVIPVAIIRLRQGQESIRWKDIVDARELPASRPGTVPSLADLPDVCVSNPASGDFLGWNSDDNCWQNLPVNPNIPTRPFIVRDDGVEQYDTIQDAIDDADLDETIMVPPGTYNESLTIASGKRVRIYGWGTRGQIIVEGSDTLATISGEVRFEKIRFNWSPTPSTTVPMIKCPSTMPMFTACEFSAFASDSVTVTLFDSKQGVYLEECFISTWPPDRVSGTLFYSDDPAHAMCYVEYSSISLRGNWTLRSGEFSVMLVHSNLYISGEANYNGIDGLAVIGSTVNPPLLPDVDWSVVPVSGRDPGDVIVWSGTEWQIDRVTAEQTGALVSVDGVSNPGGDVDLVAGSGITITPDNTAKQITIGADEDYLDSRYVNVSGDMMTGALVVDNDVGPSDSRVYYNLASYKNSGGLVTGTMKITLPKSWSNTMMRIRIVGYDFSGSAGWEATISGYNYEPSQVWVYTAAELRGNTPFATVRLAHDGTKNCILLGNTATVWRHPHVVISEMLASHWNITGWETGWGVDIITDESGITNIIIPPIRKFWHSENDGSGSGLDADSVDGQHLPDLDSRYVNVSGDTMAGILTVPGLGQPAGSYIFGYGDLLDPYIRTNDMVFDVLQGRPPATAELWNGSTWETIDASAFRSLFRGGGFLGNYTMANGSGAIRLIWNNMPDTRFVKLAIFNIHFNNAISVKCETSADGTTWIEKFTTPSLSAGSGWLMRHGYFYNFGQTPYFRLTITPTWNDSNPIYLACIRFFCINPYGATYALHPFTWDVDRVVTFVQTPKVNTDTVWHSGNDGPGSGLDADSVDGKHLPDLDDRYVNTDETIGTSQIADEAVTTEKIADDAVTTAKIADGAVTAEKIVGGHGSGLDADKLDGLELSAIRGAGAVVKRTTDQTIPNDTVTVVLFDTELVDIGDCYDPNQPDRIVAPTDGVYLIQAQVMWGSNTVGTRALHIVLGGTVIAMDQRSVTAEGQAAQSISVLRPLQANQYVQMAVYQNSGGALNIEPYNDELIELGMFRLY